VSDSPEDSDGRPRRAIAVGRNPQWKPHPQRKPRPPADLVEPDPGMDTVAGVKRLDPPRSARWLTRLVTVLAAGASAAGAFIGAFTQAIASREGPQQTELPVWVVLALIFVSVAGLALGVTALWRKWQERRSRPRRHITPNLRALEHEIYRLRRALEETVPNSHTGRRYM
jgi:hypothetical protein